MVRRADNRVNDLERFSRMRSMHNTIFCTYIFMCLRLSAWQVKRFIHVSRFSSILSISSPRLLLPRAGDISNASVKQPGLHSRVSLHNEYRVIGHLKSAFRFEMWILDSEKFSNFKTYYIAERKRKRGGNKQKILLSFQNECILFI